MSHIQNRTVWESKHDNQRAQEWMGIDCFQYLTAPQTVLNMYNLCLPSGLYLGTATGSHALSLGFTLFKYQL